MLSSSSSVLVTWTLLLPIVHSTPLRPTLSSCLDQFSPIASESARVLVNDAFANLVSANDAKEQGLVEDGQSVLRVDLVGSAGQDIVGYDNVTNKLVTLLMDTTTAHVNVYSSATWLCNSIFPPTLPQPYFPYNTTYCSATTPFPAGDFAINMTIPLHRSYALTTVRTQVRIVDTTAQAATLACYNMEFTQYKENGWCYELIFWLLVAIAIGYWTATWAARFAAGWVVGSGVAEYDTKEGTRASVKAAKREARMRKWGTMIVSGLSGERLSVSAGLLRFVTPGLRDIIYHIQFCTILGMIAVNWPTFAYPIFAQGAWSDLVWNVTLVQGSDPNSKRPWPYPSNYTPPTNFDTMINDPNYPLFLDSGSYNPLLDLHGAKDGMSSFAAAVGLREQDLFGTCLAVFLSLVAGVALLSLFLWIIHGLIEHFSTAARRSSATPPQRSSIYGSPHNSLGGKEALDPNGHGLGLEGTLLPSQSAFATNRNASVMAPSPSHRTWFRFRPRGEAGAFHAAALYGNLLRMILIFHLPITAFSIYQLTLSHASIVSRVFAALAFVFITVLIPAGVLFKVKQSPSGKLYDATRTLLSLGPIYNVYVEDKQMFRVFPLFASLVEGIVVGAGQKSGLAQAIVLIFVELVMLVLPAVWYPWGEGASMGAPSAFLGSTRVASALVVLLLSPTISLPASTNDWLAYSVLLLQAIVFVFFILMLLTKVVEGLIRLFGGATFDESTSHLDGGIFAAIMDLDCLNGVRGGKAAARKRRKRGSRQLQRNVSAAGSLTTQMMLDRHSQGVTRQPVSEGHTPFLPSRPSFGGLPPETDFPTLHPPLGPPPQGRRSSDSHSDEPSHSGHIMDAWRPSGQYVGYAHPGAYVASASSPPREHTPDRSFSVIRGSRANYQNPYQVKDGPSSPVRSLSPSSTHHRQQSSSATIEAMYDATKPRGSLGAVPTLYASGRTDPQSSDDGLRPPALEIPKRRSLNNLKDEASPDHPNPSVKKGKRRSRSIGWFGKGDAGDSESSPAEESDDEPGPRWIGYRRVSHVPAPSPLGEKQGWRVALGLVRKRSLDYDEERVRDENKARKAALAAQSGSLFAGVDAPMPPTPSTKRGFVVNRKGTTSQSMSAEGSMKGMMARDSAAPVERSFKVKRMGQLTPEPLAPSPAGAIAPSRVSPLLSPSPGGTSCSSPRTHRLSLPSAVTTHTALMQDSEKADVPQQQSARSFKVLGRPVSSPASPPASPRFGSGSFVVNRQTKGHSLTSPGTFVSPPTYPAPVPAPLPPPRSTSSEQAAQATSLKPSTSNLQNVGYAPSSFVPISHDTARPPSRGSMSSASMSSATPPARPPKNPRRESMDSNR